jgi:uncharacterized protein (TIGR02058 family)
MNVTEAASRAVKDAVSHCCMCGLVEALGLKDLNNDMRVSMKIAAPDPERVDSETLKKIACRRGHAVYTRDIALKKNEYMCPDHEIMENYEGKKSYYQIAVLNKIDFRKYEEDNIDALTGRTWAEED